MKNISLLLLIGTTILITACSGKPKVGADAIASTEGKVCRYEKSTGSHLGTRVCRTPEQMEHEKEAAKEAMRSMGKGGVVNGDGR